MPKIRLLVSAGAVLINCKVESDSLIAGVAFCNCSGTTIFKNVDTNEKLLIDIPVVPLKTYNQVFHVKSTV